jgi:hypothetical protein
LEQSPHGGGIMDDSIAPPPGGRLIKTSTLHGHLWHSKRERGLHAPFGVLVRDHSTGDVCCHLCGSWFKALGSHVRVHGYSATQYRMDVGLSKTRPLTSPSVSLAISKRQTQRYRSTPEVREWFAHGHNLARNGNLAARAAEAGTRVRAETMWTRRETLERGRATQSQSRESRRQSLLAARGFDRIDEFLRAEYAQGASLADLARSTRLGRAQLSAAMSAAGIIVRPPGSNTPAGKRSRARRSELVAAQRIGTDDLHRWLREHRASGWTLQQLAEAVGHSAPWVRWRLDHHVDNRASVSEQPEQRVEESAQTGSTS